MSIPVKIVEALVIATIMLSSAQAQLVITEIMYNPAGADTHREWIEIYNKGIDEINISSWKLFEDNASHELAPSVGEIIRPGEYGVISESPQQFLIDYPQYDGILVDTYYVSLSNTGESLALQNPEGTIVDSLFYNNSWGGDGNNKTLEKKILDEDNGQGNWGESSINGGTPGMINSVSQALPPNSTSTSSSTLYSTTSSTTSIPDTEITSFCSSTTELGTTTSSLETTTTTTSLQTTTTTSTTTTISAITLSTTSATSFATTTAKTTTTAITSTSMQTSSTSWISSLSSSTTQSSTTLTIVSIDELTIAINEIMYNPPDKDNHYEWIELYNYGLKPIDLHNWTISDNGDDSETLTGFNDTLAIIQPYAYALIMDESTLITPTVGTILLTTGDGSICTSGLSNTGETLRLFDIALREVDSVSYLPSWGGNGEGMSLEKKNPEEENEQYNWGESLVYNGTPGYRNSIYSANQPKASKASSTSTTSTTNPYIEKCGDGTPLGECSKNRPYYCFDSILVLRCSKCGCRMDYSCIEDECVKIKYENDTLGNSTEKQEGLKEGDSINSSSNKTENKIKVSTKNRSNEKTVESEQELEENEGFNQDIDIKSDDVNRSESPASGFAGFSILSKAAEPKAVLTIALSAVFGAYLLHKKRRQDSKVSVSDLYDESDIIS